MAELKPFAIIKIENFYNSDKKSWDLREVEIRKFSELQDAVDCLNRVANKQKFTFKHVSGHMFNGYWIDPKTGVCWDVR